MPPQLMDQLKKLGAQVNGMSLGQKVIAVIGIGVLLLGGSAFYTYSSKPDYEAAYSGLTGTDAGDIRDNLVGQGIDAKIEGDSVTVPVDQMDDAKAKTAQAGLPKGEASTSDVLAQMGVTSTQLQQRVALQNALENKIATTLEHLDGVQTAVVQLAMPEETVYTEQKQPVTASVLIDTGSRDASTELVNSIISLVSGSVPELKPSSVSVTDSKGELLSVNGQGAGSGDERTATYETKTQSTIQAMLDKTLGPGKAITSVNATLNFDQTNRLSTTYTPSGALPSSQATSEEVYNGGNSAVGGGLGVNGVLGVDGTSTTAGAGTTAGQGGYSKKSNTQDNANNTVVDNTVVAPGAVERQSVAVMVDQAALAGIGQQNLEQVVATAAGFDQARGDVVTITPATFDTSAADAAAKQLAAAKAEQKSEEQWALIKQGAIALGVLLLAIILLVAWRRAVKKNRREAVDLGELERLYPEAPLAPAPMTALAPATDDGHLLVAPDPEPEALRRQEFGQLVDTQPAEVANLLRGWLAASKKG